MKGKEAAQSANRRVEAIEAHVDRLTNELVAAKIRAKEAEARAARLEGIEQLLPRAAKQNDDMLVDALANVHAYKTVFKEIKEAAKEAMGEIGHKLYRDLNLPGIQNHTVDRMELLLTRYPKLMALITGGTSDNWRGPFTLHDRERKLSEEQVKRLQHLHLERLGFPEDRDAADIWNDVLDSREAGFTPEEMVEYTFGPEALAQLERDQDTRRTRDT